jgi:DNA modification methylase
VDLGYNDFASLNQARWSQRFNAMKIVYRTKLGIMLQGTIEEALDSQFAEKYNRKVDLIFTSPPFPLTRKKKYGNLQGQEYIDWLSGFADGFKCLLKPRGSVVIEVGNSWEPGRPEMSTLGIRSLLAFLEKGQMVLCEQFIWHNPARLPGPAYWVTIKRIRVTDAITHIWWMSKSDYPKANNRRVLREYSPAMKNLLRTQKYNSGKRPSGHHINQSSFLNRNKGAIPSNLISLANTNNSPEYLEYCKRNDLEPHPARMPMGVAEFFIKFLTKEGDLILDPFAGSNTTGAAAEKLGRSWISIEPQETYILGSRGRFPGLRNK